MTEIKDYVSLLVKRLDKSVEELNYLTPSETFAEESLLSLLKEVRNTILSLSIMAKISTVEVDATKAKSIGGDHD